MDPFALEYAADERRFTVTTSLVVGTALLRVTVLELVGEEKEPVEGCPIFISTGGVPHAVSLATGWLEKHVGLVRQAGN